jgi:hypothetical protein
MPHTLWTTPERQIEGQEGAKAALHVRHEKVQPIEGILAFARWLFRSASRINQPFHALVRKQLSGLIRPVSALDPRACRSDSGCGYFGLIDGSPPGVPGGE